MTINAANPDDVAQIERLVDGVGWGRARPLLVAVASIERREQVCFVSHREAQTLKIALAVLGGPSS